MIAEGIARTNLAVAWLWILLGFASGTLMGMKFHQPDWLGGYTSHKRRLYRLGHISFFGLGAVNFMFALSVGGIPPSARLTAASIALITGAIFMPLVCLLFAHNTRLRMLFSIPVVALLCGGILTLLELTHL